MKTAIRLALAAALLACVGRAVAAAPLLGGDDLSSHGSGRALGGTSDPANGSIGRCRLSVGRSPRRSSSISTDARAFR